MLRVTNLVGFGARRLGPGESTAFPQVAAVANSQGNTTGTASLSTPSGLSAGDLILCILFVNVDGNVTPPAGFASAGSVSASGNRMSVFFKVADGSEGGTLNFGLPGGGSASHRSTTYRITGHGGEVERAGSATSNPPSLTPTWGAFHTLWFAAVGETTSSPDISGAPTNYTNLQISESGVLEIGSARRELIAASEDPGTFSAGGTVVCGTTIAVKPVIS